MPNKNTTKPTSVGSTEVEDLTPTSPAFRRLWWDWYESLNPQQRAEHYWYHDVTKKNTWPKKARVLHYSAEMRRYPHIQAILKEKEDQHRNYDRRKRRKYKAKD